MGGQILPLSCQSRRQIAGILKQVILTKLERYEPETKFMPFHDAIMGLRNRVTFSLIHSINTSLGDVPGSVEIGGSPV